MNAMGWGELRFRALIVSVSLGGVAIAVFVTLAVDHLIQNAEHGVSDDQSLQNLQQTIEYMARSQLEVIDRIGKQEAFGDALRNLVKRPKAS